MAMAYCETCGSVGNFTRCPLARFPDDEGLYQFHRVTFDEPGVSNDFDSNGVDDDARTDNSSTDAEPGTVDDCA